MKSITITLIALAACTPDVPANPSFQQDVLPILAANCIRCHSTPAIGGAPETFRLDSYEDVIVREPLLSGGVCAVPNPHPDCLPIVIAGAASMAERSALRVADDDRPMPPRFQIDDHQIELLEAWVANGAERGEPRPGNGAPTAGAAGIERDDILRIHVQVDDPDRDVVGGSLHARIGGVETFIGLVQSGEVELEWDARGLAPGTHPLFLRLDDGAGEVVHELGIAVTVGDP